MVTGSATPWNVASSDTAGSALDSEMLHLFSSQNACENRLMVSIAGYGDPAAQTPTEAFVFAAVMASRSVHLPGSAASATLFTKMVFAAAPAATPMNTAHNTI